MVHLGVLERFVFNYLLYLVFVFGFLFVKYFLFQIRTLEMLRSRFEQLPFAFNKWLIPAENSEKAKKGLKATLSRRITKVKFYYLLISNHNVHILLTHIPIFIYLCIYFRSHLIKRKQQGLLKCGIKSLQVSGKKI